MRETRSNDEGSQKPNKSGAWKLVVGLVLVINQVRIWLIPDRDFPAVLHYSNGTQRLAGKATQFLIFLVGIWLIVDWARALWLKPKQ